MKTIQEMISVMKAYADGKEIEYKLSDDDGDPWWITDKPDWDWSSYDFRVKPEPTKKKIVPYESAEEFLQAQKVHGPYILIEDAIRKAYVIPIAIKDEGVYFTKDEGLVLYSSLLSMFHTWQDGTPCGKEVEE